MSISMFSDTYTDLPAEAMHDIRYIGAISGCYSLSSREKEEGAVNVFACRTQSISTKKLVIDAPVRGELGELVSTKLEEFDIISGIISQRTSNGFIIDILANEEECTKIAGKIDWVKKNKFRSFQDKRNHKRIMPPNPQSAITLGDGAVVECFVIDMSQSGVAVSADISPKAGTRLAVGRAVGTVTRGLDVGFAVQFEQKLALDELDSVFAWSLQHLKENEDAGGGETKAEQPAVEPTAS